jgi:hypothetical protein
MLLDLMRILLIADMRSQSIKEKRSRKRKIPEKRFNR